MKNVIRRVCVIMLCLTTMVYTPCSSDFFGDLFKGVDFDKLSRDLGLDNLFDEKQKKGVPPMPGQEPSIKRTTIKKPRVKGATPVKSLEALFLEPFTTTGPQKQVRLPDQKRNAFNKVMYKHFIKTLKALEKKVDALSPEDIFPYKEKIDTIVVVYELLKEHRKYLNIFYLDVNTNLRKKIFVLRKKLYKLNQRLRVPKEKPVEVSKLLEKPELEIPEFQPIAKRTRSKVKAKAKAKKSKHEPIAKRTRSKTAAKAKATDRLIKQLKIILAKEVSPIADGLAKMIASKEFKQALEQKKKEREQKERQISRQRSRWRPRRRYSSPRRYGQKPSPRRGYRGDSSWRPGRSYGRRPYQSRSSYSRPTSRKPSYSSTRPTSRDRVKSKPSSTTTKSDEPIYRATKKLTEKEKDALSKTKNLYSEIIKDMGKLNKKKDLVKSEFEKLAKKIEEKNQAKRSLSEKQQKDIVKPKTLPKTYKKFLNRVTKSLDKTLEVKKDESLISTLIKEVEDGIGEKNVQLTLRKFVRAFIPKNEKQLNPLIKNYQKLQNTQKRFEKKPKRNKSEEAKLGVITNKMNDYAQKIQTIRENINTLASSPLFTADKNSKKLLDAASSKIQKTTEWIKPIKPAEKESEKKDTPKDTKSKKDDKKTDKKKKKKSEKISDKDVQKSLNIIRKAQ